jgi:hypothetical protein
MSLVYRRVDAVLSANGSGEVREGDCLLIEVGRAPMEGELALVKRGAVEALCRWSGGREGEPLGLVIGVRRRL